MKAIFKASIFSLLFVSGSNAATVAVGRDGSTNGYSVYAADGVTNLSAAGGFYFSVGTFASEPVITTAASLASVITNSYSEFASVLTPTSGGTTGALIGSFVATKSGFNSATLYFVIGNGTTLANSTELAILKGDPTAFLFPADSDTGSGSTSISLTGAGVASPLTNAGAELDITGAPDRLTLVAVPEPSMVFLATLSGLVLLRRRRN